VHRCAAGEKPRACSFKRCTLSGARHSALGETPRTRFARHSALGARRDFEGYARRASAPPSAYLRVWRAGHAFVMRGPFRRMPEPVKGARREDRSRAPHPSCAGRR
jgi:hypothetical protein